jgi:hypothetical protein
MKTSFPSKDDEKMIIYKQDNMKQKVNDNIGNLENHTTII